MKKVITSLLLLAACHRSSTATMTLPVAGSPSGATDAASALRGFMAAAKSTDLQGLSAFWGDQDGAARDRLPRAELEKRELFMVQCLKHDKYEITGDTPAVGGGRAMVVKLTYRELTRATEVQVVRGPENRWYVKAVSVTKLQDICMRRS